MENGADVHEVSPHGFWTQQKRRQRHSNSHRPQHWWGLSQPICHQPVNVCQHCSNRFLIFLWRWFGRLAPTLSNQLHSTVVPGYILLPLRQSALDVAIVRLSESHGKSGKLEVTELAEVTVIESGIWSMLLNDPQCALYIFIYLYISSLYIFIYLYISLYIFMYLYISLYIFIYLYMSLLLFDFRILNQFWLDVGYCLKACWSSAVFLAITAGPKIEAANRHTQVHA